MSKSLEYKTVPLILLAEDRESNIETIRDYLMGLGYQLIIATNGLEAVDLAKAYQPQVIIMDIQMPGMDGLEAMQYIRQEEDLRSVPIIALTALDMPRDREKCLASGANEYLTKPVRLKNLVSTISNLLQPDSVQVGS